MTIKCAIFDADGVLINFQYFTVELEKRHGISHDDIQSFFDEEFVNCLTGKKDLKEAIAPYLEKCGWKASVEEFLDFWFKAEDRPNVQLIEYIKDLRERGIKTVIATNQEKYRTEYLSNVMGFNRIFDAILCSGVAGFRKPDAQFFNYLEEKTLVPLGVSKDECVFFDDSGRNVAAANEFGIKSFEYTDFENFKKDIDSLFD